MTAKVIGILATVGVVAVLGVSLVSMGVGYSNSEIKLRNLCEAQQKANTAIYDEVWKVIKQKAQITDKYATDFKEIYGGLMKERYQGESQGAPMFKFIKEHNPSFSVEMYKDLADAVSGQRAKFTMVQKRLIDIKREHNDLLTLFPSKYVVGSRPALEIQIITSTKTKKVFAEGVDDDVELF